MKTDNELIAEFIGITHDVDPNVKSKKKYYHYNELMLMSSDLHFDTSWDWLMPAWFKFQNCCKELLTKHFILTEYHFLEKDFLRGIHEQNISVSYKALVEGIKWYNKNKPEQHEPTHN